MPQTETAPRYSCAFMLAGHGHLKIEWEEKDHDQVVQAIQQKMDAGVAFFILDPASTAKKPPLVEIETASAAPATRKVFIKDADIKKLVESGFATIASFAGVPEMKTKGKAKTAAQAARSDTVAVQPAQGG